MGSFRDWLLRGLMPASAASSGWYPVVREPRPGAWQRNQEWRLDSVLSHPTVYRCVMLIASDVAKMRARLMELAHEPDLWVEVESPAFSPFLRRPNRYQSWAQFAKWWIISKLVHGNTYVLLERDDRRVVTAAFILDPNRVTVLVAPDGDVFYDLKVDNLAGWPEGQSPVPSTDIIHDRIPLFHPLVGVSPLYAAGGPASIGLTVQTNSASYFDNDNSPPGLLIAPGQMSELQAKEAVARWHAREKGQIAAIGNGLQYQPLRGTAVESQTVDHLNWTAESVAAAFGVPAFMVGAGPVPAVNNTEALTRQYFTACLHSYVHDMESALDDALGLYEQKTNGRRLGIALDTSALLQMDTATQYETLTNAIRGGLLTPNEGRAQIDRTPLTGGDTIYLQHQDYPIEALYDRTLEEPATALPPAQAAEQTALPPAKDEGDSDDDARAAHIRLRTRSFRMRMAA